MLVRSPADVGRLLKERCTKSGLSQQELAERIGVSRQWVMKVERGHARRDWVSAACIQSCRYLARVNHTCAAIPISLDETSTMEV